MKRITRAVTPLDLRELLEDPPRATLAFVAKGAVQAIPVAFRWRDDRYFVGTPPEVTPPAGRVKVLVDDGRWYFELHGVWVRGFLAPCGPPLSAPKNLAWFELEPEKVVAWHYGRMRPA